MFWQRKKSGKPWLSMMFLVVAVSFEISSAQSPRKQTINNFESLSQKIDSAMQAMQNNDFAIAGNILKKIIAAEPKNVAAQTLAGIVADRQNDLAAAEKHFAVAAKLQPNAPETRNNYGAILFRLGKLDVAAREFELSLKANPNQPSAQINLGQIYFAENTPAKLNLARQLFEKASIDNADVAVLRAVVVIDLRLGEKKRAINDYRRYSLAAKTSVLPVAMRTELGAALLTNNLTDEAVSELEAASAIDSSNVEALVLLSRAYLKQKNIKSAGLTLESALSRKIDDARIYAALADVYVAGGYYENAIPAMRLAIERDPRNEQYRYRYGMLLIETKAPPAAVIRLKEAVKEFPDSAQIWLGLGIAQYHDGKLDDAERSINQALNLNSQLISAYAYLALIKNVAGQSEEASSYFKRALAIDEKNAVLHYLLADNLQKIATSDPGKVETHLLRAIELDSELGGAFLALGRIYVRQKKFTEAAAMLEKTIRLEPNRMEAYYQLAQVYSRLKRAEESQTLLAKFKELSERDKNQTKTEYTDLLRRMANVQF
jgi:tetratricopeptide (TPR) repeat protein